MPTSIQCFNVVSTNCKQTVVCLNTRETRKKNKNSNRSNKTTSTMEKKKRKLTPGALPNTDDRPDRQEPTLCQWWEEFKIDTGTRTIRQAGEEHTT